MSVHPTNSDHQIVLLGASPAKVCRHSGVRFQYVSGHGADDCLGSVMLGCIAVYKTWCFFLRMLGMHAKAWVRDKAHRVGRLHGSFCHVNSSVHGMYSAHVEAMPVLLPKLNLAPNVPLVLLIHMILGQSYSRLVMLSWFQVCILGNSSQPRRRGSQQQAQRCRLFLFAS